jgi:hypothetical protein
MKGGIRIMKRVISVLIATAIVIGVIPIISFANVTNVNLSVRAEITLNSAGDGGIIRYINNEEIVPGSIVFELELSTGRNVFVTPPIQPDTNTGDIPHPENSVIAGLYAGIVLHVGGWFGEGLPADSVLILQTFTGDVGDIRIFQGTQALFTGVSIVENPQSPVQPVIPIRPPSPIRVEIHPNAEGDGGFIHYITISEVTNAGITIVLSVTGEDVDFFSPVRPTGVNRLPGTSTVGAIRNRSNGNLEAAVAVNGTVAAGSVVLLQEFEGDPNNVVIKRSETSVSANSTILTSAVLMPYVPVVTTTAAAPVQTERMRGDVNGDGVVNISDAIEILRFLAGMSNIIDSNEQAFNAARILGRSYPEIGDVIEILRYLAGMNNAIAAVNS